MPGEAWLQPTMFSLLGKGKNSNFLEMDTFPLTILIIKDKEVIKGIQYKFLFIGEVFIFID